MFLVVVFFFIIISPYRFLMHLQKVEFIEESIISEKRKHHFSDAIRDVLASCIIPWNSVRNYSVGTLPGAIKARVYC